MAQVLKLDFKTIEKDEDNKGVSDQHHVVVCYRLSDLHAVACIQDLTGDDGLDDLWSLAIHFGSDSKTPDVFTVDRTDALNAVEAFEKLMLGQG